MVLYPGLQMGWKEAWCVYACVSSPPNTSGLPCPLLQAVHELAAAIIGGRAAAAALTIVALQQPAWRYQQLCSMLPPAGQLDLTIIDCFSDPYGWGGLAPGSVGSRSSSCTGITPLPGVLAAPDGLQQLQQQLLGDSGSGSGNGQPLQLQLQRQTLVVFDSLSPLLDAFPATAVAQLLSRLAVHPGTAGLLCGLHADLHPPAMPAVVEQLAAGSLSLLPVSDLERSVCAASTGQAPQGRAEARLRRRTGRVRAESQLYCIDDVGAATFLEPPPDVRNPAAAAEKAAAAAAAAGGMLGACLGRFMRQACPEYLDGATLSSGFWPPYRETVAARIADRATAPWLCLAPGLRCLQALAHWRSSWPAA